MVKITPELQPFAGDRACFRLTIGDDADLSLSADRRNQWLVYSGLLREHTDAFVLHTAHDELTLLSFDGQPLLRWANRTSPRERPEGNIRMLSEPGLVRVVAPDVRECIACS
jgi:hypothetical protein